MTRRARGAVLVAASLLAAGPLIEHAAAAPPPSPKPPKAAASGEAGPARSTGEKAGPDRIPASQRSSVLGDDYTTSPDLAWDTSSDAAGFHLLVADEKSGYAWRTAASLSEPGIETDMWIGNACLADAGHAVVTYAPRTFTNEPRLMARGAFAATVDLTTGKVTKLGHTASLAYFSPGCGADGRAVLSQFSDETTSKKNETRLIPVDVRTGKVGKPLTLAGQVTSAVPVDDGWVAADGNRLVKIDQRGQRRTVAVTGQTPFQLTADSDGGVTFLDRTRAAGKQTAKGQVKRVTADRISGRSRAGSAAPTLVEGDLTALDLSRTATGTVVVTGRAESKAELPAALKNPGGIDKDARVSTHGHAAVNAVWADAVDPRGKSPEELGSRPARIDMTHLVTGEKTVFEVTPETEEEAQAKPQGASAPSPVLSQPQARTASATASSSTTAAQTLSIGEPESVRTCAVERGNPELQAMQPRPRQVEWAVDQAITGTLDQGASRPADWNNTGLPAYSPQALAGGLTAIRSPFANRRIPSQIMLGITAQESNMWQASRFAAPGMMGNPLIGNYYGVEYDPSGATEHVWFIDWTKADCGYGVTQVTDGMRLAGKEKPGETAKAPLAQKAIALDYAANIAFGVNILAEKWNQVYAAGMQVNDGDPLNIENWTMALWAYNSGFHPESDAGDNAGQWGLGWTNNPAMPWYKANRLPFLEKQELVCGTMSCSTAYSDDYSHAAHPQDWPYQEKVIGWAARPLSAMDAPGEYVAGYRPAWWTTSENRSRAKPPVDAFCDASNSCDPALIVSADEHDDSTSPCLRRSDFRCWWTKDVRWKDCSKSECGYELLRFDPGYAPQPNGVAHPNRCTAGLPSGTVVVDNLDAGQPIASTPERFCQGSASSAGQFSFSFAGGTDSARMDVHQLSGGHLNHMWFSHTAPSHSWPTAVTGTWTAPDSVRGWYRVLVHMPSVSARSQQAKYTVSGTDSSSPQRVAPQPVKRNEWRSLGAFNFTSRAQVSLSNVTFEGPEKNVPIAWDAVAFQPLGAEPYHVVGMGDSYASGEGASVDGGLTYLPETDYEEEWGSGKLRNTCHRSKNAWVREAKLPGRSQSVGEITDAHGSVELSFVACSGARTYHVKTGGLWQGTSLPQVDLGYLDQNTDLVTLSIGGNDARFSDLFTKCVTGGTPVEWFEDGFDPESAWHCKDGELDSINPDNGKPIETDAGDTVPTSNLETYVPAWIDDSVGPRVTEVLRQIKERAPNARVVLMGYPALLSQSDKTCMDGGTVEVWNPALGIFVPIQLGLHGDEQDWLNNTLAPRLTDRMRQAAQDAGAEFIDPDSYFTGRRICDTDQAIWGLEVLSEGAARADSTPLMKSFHPKTAGAALFARALENGLNS
ncbi:GDSL-type esterase/lipase family protein [Streptomyces sp. NPDC007863]|uniref:GDSL-type esterase/lipase family protein n=1 Tax=Streptomyces sp. NPDC007863 TaxID=3154894 RepID=UPI0033EFE01F